MNHCRAWLATVAVAIFLSCSARLAAQTVVEIPSMTVPFSFVEMDQLSPGPTTVQDVNQAGTNGGASIAALRVASSFASTGNYDLNTNCGNALAMVNNALAVIRPMDNFQTFAMRVDLSGPSTEFGIGVGDWFGALELDFYVGTTLVTSGFISSRYQSCLPKYFQLQGAVFDRIDIRAATMGGNWVITDLYIEQPIGGLQLSVSNLVEGSVADVLLLYATPNSLVGLGYSISGPGPSSFATGLCGTITVDLSPPVFRLPVVSSGTTGRATWSSPVPAGTAGFTLWLQALDVASCSLSNVVSEVIG